MDATVAPEVSKNFIRKYTRNGKSYTAYYRGETLLILTNTTTGDVIPPESQTFRRLADGNRGSKFTPA